MMKWRTFARVTGDYVELDHELGLDTKESVAQHILNYSIDHVEYWPDFVKVLSIDGWFPVEIEE